MDTNTACLQTDCLECMHKHIQTNSLNFAAVVGFLQVLVQFDDPLLILLLLNAGHLLKLTGPFVLQHLLKEDKVKH